VILIGEMRDEETVQTPCRRPRPDTWFFRRSTVDATESINRMLDFFPLTSTHRRAA